MAKYTDYTIPIGGNMIQDVKPSNCIIFKFESKEVIRIDQLGFHYNGQFIEDAGEVYHLFFEFLRQHQSNQQAIEPQERTLLVPAAQPIPVSERLPGPEDCLSWPDEPDATHWCWFGSGADGSWSWEQRSAGDHMYRHRLYTHWLPAHALPLPSHD